MESVDNILQASSWHNVVLTYDNDSIKLYVDGQVVASNNETVDLTPTGLLQNFVVGSNMTGCVDEIQFYDKVLTTEEVGHIAYEGNYSATLANYDLKFNELKVEPIQVIDSKTGARYNTTNANYEDGFVDGSKSIRFTSGGDVSLGDVDLSQKNAVSISTWVNLDTLTNTGQTIVKKDGVIDMAIENKDIKLTLGSTPITFTDVIPTAPLLNDEKFSFSDPSTAFNGNRVESYISSVPKLPTILDFPFIESFPSAINYDAVAEFYHGHSVNINNGSLKFIGTYSSSDHAMKITTMSNMYQVSIGFSLYIEENSVSGTLIELANQIGRVNISYNSSRTLQVHYAKDGAGGVYSSHTSSLLEHSWIDVKILIESRHTSNAQIGFVKILINDVIEINFPIDNNNSFNQDVLWKHIYIGGSKSGDPNTDHSVKYSPGNIRIKNFKLFNGIWDLFYVYDFKINQSTNVDYIDINEIYDILDINQENLTISLNNIKIYGSGHYIADGASISTLVDGTIDRPYVRWTKNQQYSVGNSIFSLSLTKKISSLHISYNGNYGVPTFDIFENGTLLQMTETVIDTAPAGYPIKYSFVQSDQNEIQTVPSFYSNQMTISFWVKTSNTSKQNIISVGENIHVGLNNNSIECDVDQLTGLATTTFGVSSFNIENSNYSGDIFNSVGVGTNSIDFDVASPNSLQTYKLKRFTFGVPFRSYAPTSLSIIGVNGTTETPLVTYPITFKNINHVYDIIIDDTNAAIDNNKIKVKFNGSGVIKVKNVGVESVVEDSITASITSNENSVTISGNVSRPGTLKVHSASSSETANVYTFKFNSGAQNIRPMPYMMILFDQNNQVIDPVDKIFKFGPNTIAGDSTDYTNIDPGHMSWSTLYDWGDTWGTYDSGKVLFTIELQQGTLLKDIVLFVHGNGGGQPTLDAYLNDTLIATTSTYVGGYVETTHNGSRGANPLADGHFDAQTFTYDGYDKNSAPGYAGKTVWSLAEHPHPAVSDYRTANNLLASTTVNLDTSFSVTFEDTREDGIYNYYLSLNDGTNVINFDDLNLSTTIAAPISSIKLIQTSKREYLQFSFSGTMEESSGTVHNNSMYIWASTNNTIEFNSFPTSITLVRWTSGGTGWSRWWATDCGRYPWSSSCSPWMAFKAWIYKSEDQGLTWTQVWHGSSASHPNTWQQGHWYHTPNVTLTFNNGEWYKFETTGDPGHPLMQESYGARGGAIPPY